MFGPGNVRIASALAFIAFITAPNFAGETVPLKGSLKGVYTLAVVQASPLVLSGTGTATGSVSHFGKATEIGRAHV